MDGTMDNQQERPTVSREFVAGLAVGEGWFGVSQAHAGKGQNAKYGLRFRPGFSLQMNDPETMKLLLGAFDSWKLPYYIFTPKKERESKTASVCVKVIGFKRVTKLLDEIQPHLTGRKADAAALVREFIELRLTKKQPTPYGQEEVDLINRIRAVNGGPKNGKPILLLESSETNTPCPAFSG